MRKMATMVLAAAAAMSMACSDSNNDAVAPNAVAVDGVYTLQTVNGQKMPYLIYQQGSSTVTVLDGQLDVADDGTWTETVNVQTVSGTDTKTEPAIATGAWYQSGSSLLFAYGADSSTYYTGTASVNRLDLNAGSVAIVYTK